MDRTGRAIVVAGLCGAALVGVWARCFRVSFRGSADDEGSAPRPEVVFFRSSTLHEQEVDPLGARKAIVRTSLEREAIEVGPSSSPALRLRIEAVFSIAGYHGTREAAGVHELQPEEVAFRVERDGDVLIPTSHEFVIIHHALFVTALRVEVPPGLELVFEQVPRSRG